MNIHEYGGRSGSGNTGGCRHSPVLPSIKLVLCLRGCGGGNGNPLQYSGLENSMDRGAWRATVHGVAKSWTRLSDCPSLTLCLSANPQAA